MPIVTHVIVRVGGLIDAVGFYYSDGTSKFSSKCNPQGGAPKKFQLEYQSGEYVTGVLGQAGDSLDCVQFETSTGRKSPVFGNPSGGSPFSPLRVAEGRNLQIIGVERSRGNFCPAISGIVTAAVESSSNNNDTQQAAAAINQKLTSSSEKKSPPCYYSLVATCSGHEDYVRRICVLFHDNELPSKSSNKPISFVSCGRDEKLLKWNFSEKNEQQQQQQTLKPNQVISNLHSDVIFDCCCSTNSSKIATCSGGHDNSVSIFSTSEFFEKEDQLSNLKSSSSVAAAASSSSSCEKKQQQQTRIEFKTKTNNNNFQPLSLAWIQQNNSNNDENNNNKNFIVVGFKGENKISIFDVITKELVAEKIFDSISEEQEQDQNCDVESIVCYCGSKTGKQQLFVSFSNGRVITCNISFNNNNNNNNGISFENEDFVEIRSQEKGKKRATSLALLLSQPQQQEQEEQKNNDKNDLLAVAVGNDLEIYSLAKISKSKKNNNTTTSSTIIKPISVFKNLHQELILSVRSISFLKQKNNKKDCFFFLATASVDSSVKIVKFSVKNNTNISIINNFDDKSAQPEKEEKVKEEKENFFFEVLTTIPTSFSCWCVEVFVVSSSSKKEEKEQQQNVFVAVGGKSRNISVYKIHPEIFAIRTEKEEEVRRLNRKVSSIETGIVNLMKELEIVKQNLARLS